ncbi:MAG: hypothetical protein ACM3QW_05085 [Ignavibacteriales bacterium]
MINFITLQIEDDNLTMVKEILNKYLIALQREISHTDNKKWLVDLKAKENLMKDLMRQLPD